MNKTSKLKATKLSIYFCVLLIIASSMAIAGQSASKQQTKANQTDRITTVNPDGTLSFTSEFITSLPTKDRIKAIKEISKRNRQIRAGEFGNGTQALFNIEECSTESKFDNFCEKRKFGGRCCTNVDEGWIYDSCVGDYKYCSGGW